MTVLKTVYFVRVTPTDSGWTRTRAYMSSKFRVMRNSPDMVGAK